MRDANFSAAAFILARWVRSGTGPLVLLALALAGGSVAIAAEVEVNPLCADPQLIGPVQPGGMLMAWFVDMAWNGQEYGVLAYDYGENRSARFQRVRADGTSIAPPVTIPSSSSIQIWPVRIVWNGTGYGIAYTADFNGVPQVFFARLDRNGTVVSGPTRVSNVGTPSPTTEAVAPGLAFSGTHYVVVWQESRGATSYDLYTTALDVNGAITASDRTVTVAPGDQIYPVVAWGSFEGSFVFAWEESVSGLGSEIWIGYMLPGAWSPLVNGALTSGAGDAFQPSIVDTGNTVGLAWTDTRDVNREIYAALLTSSGGRVSGDVRLTNNAGLSNTARIVWTGGEFGVFFLDDRVFGSGLYDLWFQRMTTSATLAGGNQQASSASRAYFMAAAFGKRGYLASFAGGGTPTRHVPWGCSAPVPPSCPEAPTAYSITGMTATTAWLSGTDLYTDIASYEVFRNAALVGTTTDTFFNDGGLSPGAQYQYNFRTVNAAGLYSTPCPDAQIYVKASSALSLSVGKSGDDIALDWTDADGQNSYRVMRGTSPQVMTEIQQTSDQSAKDPAAAVGSVCYFYSIDTPQD